VAESTHRDSVCSEVARILREERERQGISMTRLAEMSGLSQGMISLVEHEHRNPSLDTLLRMTGPLGITLSIVLSRAERAADQAAGKLAATRKP
jgi:transcriptional regulator with XRE-family HTH domain